MGRIALAAAGILTIPLKYIEYGISGDLIIIYPKPYSIYLRETICLHGIPATASGRLKPIFSTRFRVKSLGFRV